MSTASRNLPPLRDAVRILFRHKWKAAGLFAAVMIVTGAIVLWYPRHYASQAKLFVRLGRESVTLDPTATTGQVISVQESRELEINSVVEMLGSRSIAEKVVDTMGPEAVLSGDKSTSSGVSLLSPVRAAVSAVANIDPVDDREKAIQQLLKSLDISAARKSSVINVRYLDRSPKHAQEIVSQLLDAFQQEHIRVNRTHGSQEFFTDQAALMKQHWEEASLRLRDAKNKQGLVSLDAKRLQLQGEASRLDEQLSVAQTSKAEAEAKVSKLQQLIASLPARKVTEEVGGHSNDALDGMRKALFDLEIRERELSAKFTDDHPSVVAIREQVKQATSILDGQDKERKHTTVAVNPAREQLQLQLLVHEANLTALIARTAALQKEHQSVQQRIKSLNDAEVQIARLSQEVTLAEANFASYAKNLEQTRIDSALQKDRISNVNIIQSASLEGKPATPRKGIVLALGLVAAVLGSLGVVLVAEQLDWSLKSAEDVEQELNLPVLASLPRTTVHRVGASHN